MPTAEKPDHFSQLVGVAGDAGIVPELALARARGVEAQEVANRRGGCVEDALASVLKFTWIIILAKLHHS